MIIKVSLPTGYQVQARITTQDGKMKLKIPAGHVERRFADKSVRVGFFDATYVDGILEIGERVPDEKW